MKNGTKIPDLTIDTGYEFLMDMFGTINTQLSMLNRSSIKMDSMANEFSSANKMRDDFQLQLLGTTPNCDDNKGRRELVT